MKLLSGKPVFENVACRFSPYIWRWICTLVVSALTGPLANVAMASDHLDSPSTVANPQADIGDVYAWTSAQGKRLNLAMTIQGHTFSEKIDYAFHIDSGKSFGHTTAATNIICRFAAADAISCQVGKDDSVSGDPTVAAGLEGRNHRFRVYAALRDDPFYNNIKGLGPRKTSSTIGPYPPL
jgi:hypothetical protein